MYLNPASKANPCCRNSLEMVESPSGVGQWGIRKEVHLFDEEEYTTRRNNEATENQAIEVLLVEMARRYLILERTGRVEYVLLRNTGRIA